MAAATDLTETAGGISGASLDRVSQQMAQVYKSLKDIQARAHAQLDGQSASWLSGIFGPDDATAQQQAGGLAQLDAQVDKLNPNGGELGVGALQGYTDGDDGTRYPYDPARWQQTAQVVYDAYAYDITKVTGQTEPSFANVWSGLVLPTLQSIGSLPSQVKPYLPDTFDLKFLAIAVIIILALWLVIKVV